MKTSSFFKAPQEGRISIARSMPRGHSCPTYRALAPGPWFKTVDYEKYRDEYAPALQQEAIKRFKDKFVAFRTLLQIV